jgi:hypothetical protein
MNIPIISDLHFDTCDNIDTLQLDEMDLIMQIEGVRDICNADQVIFHGNILELQKYSNE